jgi:hypothetical protein
MLDDYFDQHSNGLHNVDFTFIKRVDGKPYTPDDSMAQWIAENGNSASNVICNEINDIALQVAENMYADNQNVFNNVNALHFVFNVGSTDKAEFNTAIGGEVLYNIRLESNNVLYFEGSITINWKSDAIPHERLHLLGLPDRPLDLSGSYGYDIMDNRGVILDEHSLFAQRPICSRDLIRFGWIAPDEILTLDQGNYHNFGEIKLADLNYSLTQLQKTQGYFRLVKVIIESEMPQYFLIEYHKATEYDKNFANHDEYSTYGYNKGILIWHVADNINSLIEGELNYNANPQIDLEIAVPYNSWENRIPIPNDGYPGFNEVLPNINQLNEGDFDWLNVISDNTKYSDGGRNIWSVSLDHNNEPNNQMEWLERTNSKRSDFFTDEIIQGYKVNRMTDATIPSTKKRGFTVSSFIKNRVPPDESYPVYSDYTHIGIVNIKRESDNGYNYMTVQVYYNYWEGEITENTTIAGNVRIGSNLTVASGVTLTISDGTNITIENGSSLIVNGTLNVEGEPTNKVTFDFQAQNSTLKNGIKVSAGGVANISNAIIKNAYNGVYVNEAVANLSNCEIFDCTYGVHFYRTNYVTNNK